MSLASIQNSIANPFSSTVNKSGARPADFPHGFVIVEYINGISQGDVDGGSIALIGNMMPFQPFEWEVEQRLVTEYYPGNREPAVQVLGPKDGTLIIKGRFKDKRIQATYQGANMYGAAYQYNLALKEMIQRGNLVKFGMHGTGNRGDWIRWGMIQKGSFKMNKLSWIDYEITFLVMGEVMPVNNFFAYGEKQAPSAVNFNLINAADDFATKYASVPDTMPLSIAGELNNLIGTVAYAIATVTGFVSTIISTAQSIEDSANRALGLIKNAQANISIFNRQINNIVHPTFTVLSVQGSPAGQVSDSYANQAYLLEISLAMNAMHKYLIVMKAQFQALAVTIPMARYRVQSGNTLQNISIKFYGVADYASTIYEHNNLSSTTLTVGSVLEIPKI